MSDLALDGRRIADLFIEGGSPNEIAVAAFACGFILAWVLGALRGRR